MRIWGKIFGFIIGYMFGRFFGAMLGMWLGHLYDKRQSLGQMINTGRARQSHGPMPWQHGPSRQRWR